MPALPAILPPVIPEPFAQNAAPGFIQSPIPQTTGTPGRASYDQGWPAETMEPVVAGGVPPWGQDFNGLMFAVTSALYFAQSGQLWPFNAAVAAFIGGYAVGAVVASADGKSQWVNVTPGNTTNPDAGAGILSGWRPFSCTAFANIPVTAGAFTVADSDARCTVIVINGVLTGNVSITLPGILNEWLLVNNTSGAFVITANAGAGTTLVVPQGGFGSPLGVYSIGDGNLYPSVSPLGVAIAQAPTPLTLVERDNNGDVNVNFLHMQPASNNTTVTQVVTANGSGYLQLNDVADFEARLALQGFGGQIQPSQIVSAAVTQFAALILASAALTGVPTATTAPRGDSSTRVATTAFVNPGSSLNPNGYRLEPDGSIEQWGNFNTNANAGLVTIPFNIPFPVECFLVTYSTIAPTGVGGAGSRTEYLNAAPGTGSFQIHEGASAAPAITISWRATGR